LEEIIIVLCKEENQRRLELEQSGQVADLIRRRLELEFNNEKKKMQSTLELTISQLNNSQKEVIDKSLIANLVVSYFKKKRLSLVNVHHRNTSTITAGINILYTYINIHPSIQTNKHILTPFKISVGKISKSS
jgi:hypothetical protein